MRVTSGECLPNTADTEAVLDALWEAGKAAKDRTANDPEGRSFTLGATMFFGVILAAIKSWDDRRIMCDAAMSYSMDVGRILEKLKHGAPRDAE